MLDKYRGPTKTPEVEFEDDLDTPLLGRVVPNETALMILYTGGTIAAFFYLAPTAMLGAVITCLSSAYLGYRDVTATINEGETADKTPRYAGALKGLLPERATVEDEEAESGETTVLPERSNSEDPLAPKPVEDPPVYPDNPWEKPLQTRPHSPTRDLPTRPLRGEIPPKEDELSDIETKAAMAKFRAPVVNELLRLPMAKRAEKLLNNFEESGCDLWPYVSDALLVFNGKQQSGKTTLAMVITILEAALHGKAINYITGDGDIYPLAFAGIADGSEFYPLLADKLVSLKKGQGGQTTWVIDEISKQPTDSTAPIWNALLTGFVKTRDTVRVITHGTTAQTMGLPHGWADQAKEEATVISGKRALDVEGKSAGKRLKFGGRYPSGEYRRQEFVKDSFVDSDDDSLKLPDWLQFDLNDEGNPCYVRSLLKYFPEMDTRAQGATPGPLFQKDEPPVTTGLDSTRSSLQGLLDAADEDTDPLEDVSELAQKLYSWVMTGAGAKLWQQRETKTAVITIVNRDDVISKGNRHRVDGATKSFHAFELSDAISELVSIRKLSRTREGHVVVKTKWKSKET